MQQVIVVVNPSRERGEKLPLGRSVRKPDGTTLHIPSQREEIRKVRRDEEESKRPK